MLVYTISPFCAFLRLSLGCASNIATTFNFGASVIYLEIPKKSKKICNVIEPDSGISASVIFPPLLSSFPFFSINI